MKLVFFSNWAGLVNNHLSVVFLLIQLQLKIKCATSMLLEELQTFSPYSKIFPLVRIHEMGKHDAVSEDRCIDPEGLTMQTHLCSVPHVTCQSMPTDLKNTWNVKDAAQAAPQDSSPHEFAHVFHVFNLLHLPMAIYYWYTITNFYSYLYWCE